MNELRTTLDTGKETYNALKCKQNDDRTLILTLLSNGVTWTPEAGSILELRGKRSDSTVTIQTTTGITITNNVVTIALSKEFTKIQGIVELELNIRKLTEITTFTFILVIEPSVIQDGAIVSKNTSSVLDELNNVLDWGSMHLVKAVNNIVSLTKKHGQYSVGLTSGTRVVLPTVKQGEYVNIDYMFYADSDLGLVFDDNIKWSNRPIIQAGRSYRFSFRYVNGVWYGEWVKLERYIKDYIYKAGDTCDVLTGGYDLERIVNSGSITADFNRYNIGLWVTKDAQINLATISSIDLTNYTKLYLNLYYKAVSDYIGSSKRLSVTIGSTVILPPRPTVIGGGRNTIHVLDVSSITGSHQISFNTPGTTATIGVDIYEAWLEKDEFVDTTQEIFTKSEKNKLASISTSANKVADSTINGNILIDNVETKVYTHPIGTNPHGTTKSDVGLGNVDNTTDLNKPISTATQTALNDKISTSQKGVANGIAQLNSNGVVPSSQLPSYVDDVLEYTSNSLFPATGESGKIYINTTTNITYRWTGSGYAEISPSIALGETSSTAYAGDKGKATTDKVNGHTGNTNNPHGVTKAQVGLSNVPNVATNSQTPTYTIASSNTALASGEVLSTAFGKIAKAINSLISHLADKVSHITSTERTNWNNKATQSNIDASINEIQIGGRNLLKSSNDISKYWFTGSSIITQEGNVIRGVSNGTTNPSWPRIWNTSVRDIVFDTTSKYTISFKIRANANRGVDWAICDLAGSVYVFYTTTSSTTEWQQIVRTFTPLNSGSGLPINLQFYTGATGGDTTSWIELQDVKLEIGNKATDWTPAPEDVDNAIATKLDKTGGTLTGTLGVTGITTLNGGLTVKGGAESSGSIFCANGQGIQGRKVDGTADNLIKRNSDNTVQIGSVSHSAFLHSYSTPTVVIPSGSYRVYHEGNKPSLSDLGTTVEYSNQLSTVSTSTSVPPRVKKWTRLATLRLTMQYQETNIQFNIMNNDASMDIITAIVSARVKQQTAMGTNPYTGVVVNGVGFNTNNFKAIMTTSAAASTLDLYVAMDEDWRTFSMSKTLSANNLSALTPLQPFIDLPADAKFVPVIFK